MSSAVTCVRVNARSEARGLKLVMVRPGTNVDVNIEDECTRTIV